MRIAALLLVAVLVAGCAHTAVGVSSGTGTAVTSGGAGGSISTGSTAAALGLVLIFGTIDYVNNPQPFPSPSSLMSPASPAAPDMAANRRISEQDCSKPVDLTLGNLRCK
jgi:hypothetical protein